MTYATLTNEMRMHIFKDGEVNAGIVGFKDSLHALGIIGMIAMLKHAKDYYDQYHDATLDILFPKGIDDHCDVIISGVNITFIMDEMCDIAADRSFDEDITFRLGHKNSGACNVLTLLENIDKVRYLDMRTLTRINHIWNNTLGFSTEIVINQLRHADIKYATFRYYKHSITESNKPDDAIVPVYPVKPTLHSMYLAETIDDVKVISTETKQLNNSKNLLTTHEIDSILCHDVGVGYTLARIRNGTIKSDFSKEEKAHGKHYIALEELKKFLLSKDAVIYNKAITKFDVDNIRKYLRLGALPEEIDIKIRGQEIIGLGVLIEILDFIIKSPNTISIGNSNSPTYDDYHGQSVRLLKFRRTSIAHIVSHNKLTPENIIFNITKDMFISMEELDVLEYMRGNLCDIIALSFPELTYVLEYIQFNDNDDAELINYENKILDFYQTEEEIYDIRVADIESLFFKDVLSLKQFNSSMFKFISSIYPNIDILKLSNLPIDEIPRDYVINLVDATLNRLDDVAKLKYITLIKKIHSGEHIL